jgi:protein-S-isoprenylcysteine O-methyltransferase Ste14
MSVLGSVWFLVLALAVGFDVFGQARSMSAGDLSATGLSSLLAAVCLFLFYLTLWWVMLVRSSPAARIDRLVPSIIAFAGGYLPWIVVLIAPSNASESLNLASTALLLIGNVLMVIVVRQLGRCFSVVPQARKLVRTGPYAIIRHPLYLVEEIALLGTLLHFFSPATLALFLLHGALQIQRMLYEENILRRTFPDYEGYAKSTSRLIPHVW